MTKMELRNNVLCSAMVLLCVVYTSSAIECYYCSSANNSACLDMELYDAETIARLIPRVNCETAVENPSEHFNFFCRKIVQTIYHKQMAELRVMRGCGWVPHHKDCYKADNRDHLETVCQCFTPYCNASDHVDPAAATFLFLLLSICLYFLRE